MMHQSPSSKEMTYCGTQFSLLHPSPWRATSDIQENLQQVARARVASQVSLNSSNPPTQNPALPGER